MKDSMKTTLSFLAFFLIIAAAVSAQPFTSSSRMWVDGTSTVHDWTVTVERVEGRVHARGAVVDSVRFSVPVRSMKSGKSGMDDKVYEALKASRHPQISVITGNVDLSSGSGVVQAAVTIAGRTKTLPVTVQRSVAAGVATYTGQVTFNMTEFNVSPPTAMLGAIKAGDRVTLRFDLKTNAN